MNRLGTVLVAILLLWLPASAQQIIDETIAVVNSDVILRSELQTEISVMETALIDFLQGAELLEAIESGRKNILRDLIDRNLLQQKAVEYGVDASLEVVRTLDQLRQDYDFETMEELEAAIVLQGDSVEDYRAMIETSYMTEMVINQEVYANITITNEEAREYYEANIDEFDRPGGVRLQEIVILRGDAPEDGLLGPELEEARVEAAEALARVRDGEDFASVAAEVSDSQTAQMGGDLGFFEAGELSGLYEDAAAELRRNQSSEIIELPDAFIILRLMDRHDGGILVFELAFQEIENYLIGLQAEDAVREYLSELRSEGFIKIKEGYVDSGTVPDDGLE
jgi:parvulin-like peptidyl-prolyl isomerase